MSAFTLQATPLVVAPEATANELAIDITCFTDVIRDLAAIGGNDSENQENLFHAIRYLATLANEFAIELQERTKAQSA
jgi:hypothetical protein